MLDPCYLLFITAEDGPNTILGGNLMAVWIWRYHNIIATALAAVNPCWDDTRLFFTTREIVIASIMQIFYYELLPLIMGTCVISSSPTF